MAADDRRTRILDAAEELFAEDGFDATPTARVADAAKVPKGLVFYYFPRKIDLLLTLLQERLPVPTTEVVTGVVRRGDPAGSLVALHRRIGLDNHDSLVLRTIIFRESGTHPQVRDHLRRLRHSLVELTESALDQAVEWTLANTLRRQAAETFVSVMLDHANARRAGGVPPDVQGAAAVVALALKAPKLA
ncbi:TetR/AcrR family transcriptional regulator [Nocardioides sp.]|uniref:TetR/AcrR family transcriptional regulator n=1 Tax=Nocardioides sp. TaxID=35761 RepID=UPI0026027D42|nr:TetR/AcrR family transcriptional regulator [Nocardioides sp.]MDI6911142.1 helix-turn-helix domain-containing protein [Nocardioides sp.]